MAKTPTPEELGFVEIEASAPTTAPAEPITPESLGFVEVTEESTSPSATTSALAGAGQGITLGFQDELSAAISAILPTALDKEMGRGYKERRKAILAQERSRLSELEEASPGAFMAGELAGGLALPGAGGASTAGRIAGSAGLGALQSLGKTEVEDNADLLKEATKGAAVSGAFSGILAAAGKVAKTLLGKKTEAAFEAGRDMKIALSDEKVQKQVIQDLKNFQPALSQAVQSAKQRVGAELDSVIQQNSGVKVNALEAFKSVDDELGKALAKKAAYKLSEKDDAARAMQNLDNVSKTLQERLLKTSPTGKLSEVDFVEAARLKQELRSMIFDDEAFSGNPYADKLAKGLYKKLGSVLDKADDSAGSAGKYKALNDTYAALANSKPEKIRAAHLKAFTDPQSTSEQLERAIKPLFSMDPALRAKLVPEVAEQLDKKMPEIVTKAKLMRLVTGRDPVDAMGADDIARGMASYALSGSPAIAGLMTLSPSVFADTANKAGVLASKIPAGVSRIAPEAGRRVEQTIGRKLSELE